ncbi:MAG: aminotransferase class III-fold pyridoxal phosphate-dependent enzyme [Bacteroidales bacterium]|nr:aminotransferase class III-fold pyridoxal phosphate-dependent enzyme [Bacteroidales bacterium]
MENIKLTKEGKSQSLYVDAKKIIPGGGQLLSKRPEQFLPDYMPAYYSKAKGCYVWDLDGNKLLDMATMGIGSCIIGYADDEINAVVNNCIENGSMSSLMAPEEVELAKLLLEMHPWAEMVRYAKGGGDAMAVAVRIARAATKKDIILFSGYHGWHDWYLSANLADDKALDGQLLKGLSPAGVPRDLKGTSYPFLYNNKSEFLSLIEKFGDNIGGVVLEAVRGTEPEDGFFETIMAETKRLEVPLIIDEVTSGFRLTWGGSHLVYGIEPDICVFAKGMANGFPMAAIIGKAKFMDHAQDSFISSTFWTERIGLTAAIATIRKMKRENVQSHLINCGEQIQAGWKKYAEKYGLNIKVTGIKPLSHISFTSDPLVLKTLFSQEMLRRGILAKDAYYASFAHKQEHIDYYLKSVDEVFAIIAKAHKDGNAKDLLLGPVCMTGFQRLA